MDHKRQYGTPPTSKGHGSGLLRNLFASMATTSHSDSLAKRSVAHLRTFLSISFVAAWCKSAVPAGLLQKKQIGSVDCGGL